MNKARKISGAIPQLLARVAPFLIPSLFFQLGFLALLSPLPIFILTLKSPIWLSLAALATNLAFLASMGGHTEIAVAGFFWFAVGILFPFLIRKSGKIQLSLVLSYIYLVAILVASLAAFAHDAKMGVVDYVHSEVSLGLDRLLAMKDGVEPFKKMIEEEGRDTVFKQFMLELPSGILMTLLISFWLNLLFASKMLQGFLSKDFWSKFKTPEWLIWPTLAFGALYAFAENAPYYIGLNGFKVLMMAYLLQGISILSFILNHYKIQGFARFLIYALSVTLSWPLLLGVGFFDLWFDFRSKFGQS